MKPKFEYHLLMFVKGVVECREGAVIKDFGNPIEFIIDDEEYLSTFVNDILTYTTMPQNIKFELTVKDVSE